MKKTALALVGVTLLSYACESDAEKARKAEAALFLQRKGELLAHPDLFLDTSDFKSFDEGIINSYRQLIGLKITNKSALTVKPKSGRVTWLRADGSEVGSSPLSFDGTLAPGMDKLYSTADRSLTSGTIQGAADRLRVEFTSVEVVETLQ